MPTELGKRYELIWRGDPPHMLKPDIPIWYRFLAIYSGPFLNLYYDCALGGPSLNAEKKRDPLEVMWRGLLVKRADAIVELAGEVWIIEVSADPGLRAVGQLISYGHLWKRDPKIDKPVKLVLVSGTIEEDLADVVSSYGGLIFIV
ncbi:unnamed protein product [marine sediment metagenome]|uniref:Uncharacterized protein n=1 Tax=marine sediment metagenome TaxID=412755 RepID=X0V238_9ZZZZ